MCTDLRQMYLDLNELLQDICHFFSGDKLACLSSKDQHLAESLIIRSKKQLQEISKIQQNLNQNNEEYMVMESKVLVIQEDKTNIYSSVDYDFKKVDDKITDEKIYPYEGLMARDASKDIKYGYMLMKRRFLLGFEKMKRVYGSIHNGWLLIYFTDKDAQPICTFNLKNYTAKQSEGDKTDFQLIGVLPGKKVYHFEALTQKDMKQWVTQINKYHNNSLKKNKITGYYTQSSDPENSIRYEGSDDDTDSTYETLKTDDEPEESTNISLTRNASLSSVKSTLNNKLKKPIRVLPPVIKDDVIDHSSEEDQGSYHEIEILENMSNTSSTRSFKDFRSDSFSDENEDSIYEQFIDVQEKVNHLSSATNKRQLQQENNVSVANMVIPSQFTSREEHVSLGSLTKPITLKHKPSLKKPPPPLPKRQSSSMCHAIPKVALGSYMKKGANLNKMWNTSSKDTDNSFVEDSDNDSTYDQLLPTDHQKAIKTIPQLGRKPPMITKPKPLNKPSLQPRKK